MANRRSGSSLLYTLIAALVLSAVWVLYLEPPVYGWLGFDAPGRPPASQFLFVSGAVGFAALVLAVRAVASRFLSANHRDTVPADFLTQRYWALLNSSNDAIAIIDGNRNIVSCNPRFLEISGYEADEIEGKSTRILHADAEGYERFGKLIENAIMGEVYSGRSRFLTKSGTTVDGTLRFSVIRDDRKNLLGIISMFDDEAGLKKAERQLQSSESSFRALIDNSLQGVGISKNSKMIYANQALADMLGYEIDKIIGQDPRNFVKPSQYQILDRIRDGNLSESFEFEAVRKDGSIVTATANIRTIEWQGGTAHMAVAEDITERRRAEEKLTEVTFHLSPLGIAHLDPEGRYLRVNKRFAGLLGYDADELIGKSFEEITFAEDLEQDRIRIKGFLAGEYESLSTEKRYVHKDGSVIWANRTTTLIRTSTGEPKFFITMFEDINERKEAEEALRQSEKSLANAQRFAHMGSWEMDFETEVIRWSEETYRIYGVDPESFVPSFDELRKFVHVDDMPAMAEAVATAKKTADEYQLKYRILRADGVLRHLHAAGEVIVDDSGNAIGIRGSIKDITDQTKVEQDLRETEREYRDLIDGSAQGIAIARDWEIVYANQTKADMHGYPLEDMIGLDYRCLFDVGSIEEANRRRQKPHLEFLEMKCLKRDGTRIWVTGSATDIIWKGKPARLMTSVDVTDRKLAEEALQKSKDRLDRAMTGTNDGLWDRDFRTSEEYLSPRWAEILGYRQDELKPKFQTVMDLMHPDDKAATRAAQKAHLEDKKPYNVEYRLRHKDGRYVWVRSRGQAEWDEDGNAFRMAGSITDITDQKLAEDALKKSEASLLHAQRMAHVGNWELDFETGKAQRSDEVFRIFGLAKDEFEGAFDAFLRAVHPDDRDYVQGKWDDAIAGKGLYNVDHRIIRKDGEIRHLHVEGQVERDDKGNAVLIRGTTQDVTDRQNTEDALRDSEEGLKHAQRIAHLGSWDNDLVTGEIYRSDEIYRIFGIAPDQMENRYDAYLDIIHPDDRDRVDHHIKNAIKLGEPNYYVNHRIVRPDGEVREILVEAQLYYDDNGTAIRMRGVTQDITERGLAERDAQERAQRLRAIMDNVADAVVTIDEDGAIDSFNAAAEKIFGYSADEAVGENVMMLMPQPLRGDHETQLHRYATTGDALVIGKGPREFCGLHKDGTEFPLEIAISEMHIGARRYFIGLMRDITERKDAEDKLRQAQKMEAVGQLTGGVAHDFNNLLAVILGNLDLADEQIAPGSELRNFLGPAARAAQRGANLTRRLLAFSRKQTLLPKVTSLNQIIEGMAELLRRSLGEQIDIELDMGADLWPCLADPSQLENALLNLALNARDAMPDGGTLTIRSSNTKIGRSNKPDADVEPGDYVGLEVVDTGSGMSKETQSRIFEPFFTTKEVGRGSGLGLSMIFGFIKQSGGHITVESELGEGTSIKLLLPRTAAASPEPKTGREKKFKSAPTGKTILVVEDNMDVRSLVVAQLSSLGFDAQVAEDSETALQYLNGSAPIDLLISDIILPGGMNGRELAQEVRRRRPGTKVLFISGYTESIMENAELQDSESKFLQKPFGKQQLAKAIHDLLDTGAQQKIQ